jgi:hypothetical protein
MKKTNTFSMINGEFTNEQAKDVLTDLFSSKIKYHSVCALRHEERFSEKSSFHANRILELKSERDAVIHLLQSLNNSGKLKIESTIHITAIESGN